MINYPFKLVETKQSKVYIYMAFIALFSQCFVIFLHLNSLWILLSIGLFFFFGILTYRTTKILSVGTISFTDTVVTIAKENENEAMYYNELSSIKIYFCACKGEIPNSINFRNLVPSKGDLNYFILYFLDKNKKKQKYFFFLKDNIDYYRLVDLSHYLKKEKLIKVKSRGSIKSPPLVSS